MPGPMPGPIDSMCRSIRSMWPTIVSHISTFVCQRAFSSALLILATFAFICSREDFIFATSALAASISWLCISIICWRRVLRVWLLLLWPLEDAGACDCVSCAHATEAKVKSRIGST